MIPTATSRLLVILMAIVLAATVFGACGDGNGDDAQQDQDRDDRDTEQTEDDVVTGPPLEDLDGEALFVENCSACHQEGATGVEGVYPALADNPFVAAEEARAVAQTVVHGRAGMPEFGPFLSDTQIAAILTYLRTELNDADRVDPETVRDARDREPLEEPTERESDPGEDPDDDSDDDAAQE